MCRDLSGRAGLVVQLRPPPGRSSEPPRRSNQARRSPQVLRRARVLLAYFNIGECWIPCRVYPRNTTTGSGLRSQRHLRTWFRKACAEPSGSHRACPPNVSRTGSSPERPPAFGIRPANRYTCRALGLGIAIGRRSGRRGPAEDVLLGVGNGVASEARTVD